MDVRRYWLDQGYLITTPPPTVLSVRKESRPVALEHYILSFRSKAIHGKTYFDFNMDTLLLDASCFEEQLLSFTELFGYSRDIEKVQTLAFPAFYRNGVQVRPPNFMTLDRLRKFKSLRTAVFTQLVSKHKGRQLLLDHLFGFETSEAAEMARELKVKLGINVVQGLLAARDGKKER